MNKLYPLILLPGLFLLAACNEQNAQNTAEPVQQDPSTQEAVQTDTEKSANSIVQPARVHYPEQYKTAREKIVYGNASMADVRLALSEQDVAELTNTVHALYSMRWHRGVFKMLYRMWELDKSDYPELNWEEIARAPVRIALASTLNRIQISDTKLFQFYIRSFREHEHEFIRAQVVVALGFNGDPADIPYLRSMIEADNDYVAQSAIAGLGMMDNAEAKEALIALGVKYQGSKRGAVIDSILKDIYKLVPAAGITQ